MSNEWAASVGRRSVLKTSGAALAGGAGVVGTAGSVTAAETCLRFCSGCRGGAYRAVVTDPDARGVSSTLESDDRVDNGDTTSLIEGTLPGPDADEYKIEGRVVEVEFFGTVQLKIDRPSAPDGTTRMRVEKPDGQPKRSYAFDFSGSYAEPLSDTEPDDFEGGGFVGGTEFRDTFEIDGGITSFDTCPEFDDSDKSPPSGDERVRCVED